MYYLIPEKIKSKIIENTNSFYNRDETYTQDEIERIIDEEIQAYMEYQSLKNSTKILTETKEKIEKLLTEGQEEDYGIDGFVSWDVLYQDTAQEYEAADSKSKCNTVNELTAGHSRIVPFLFASLQ